MLEMGFPIGHLEPLVYVFHLIVLMSEYCHGFFKKLDLCLAVVQLAVVQVATMVMHR